MKRQRKAYLRLSVIVVVLAAAAGCTWIRDRISGPPPVSAPKPDLRDSLCDPNDPKLAADCGYNAEAVNFAHANGYYGWCIPEYDDDQRLSDGNLSGKDYGPVAHVLAPPWLDTLQFNTTFRQVAILQVDSDPGFSGPFAPYDQLGLGHLNCIYLRHPASGDTSFQALIIPPDPTSQVCPVAPTGGSVAPTGGSVTPLAVAMEQPAGVDSASYPPTTRFVETGDGRTLIVCAAPTTGARSGQMATRSAKPSRNKEPLARRPVPLPVSSPRAPKTECRGSPTRKRS